MANNITKDVTPSEARFLDMMQAGIDPASGKPFPKTSDPGSFFAAVPKQDFGLRANLGRFDKGYRIGMSQEDVRGYNQSVFGKWFNGIVGRGISIAPKFIKQISDLAGMAGAGLNLDTEFQNGLSRFMEEIDQNALKQAFPVFTSQDYREGTLSEKLGTASFWTTEALDGLAYLGASFVGTKGAGLLTKFGVKTLGKTALATSLKAWGLTQSDISVWTATAFNTAMESATEASGLRKDIYMDLINKGVPHDVAIQKAARASHDSFWMNMSTLWLSNRMEAGWFTPKSMVARKAMLMDGLMTGSITKEALQEAAKMSTRKSLIQPFIGGALKASAMEGMWEENVQNAIERYEKHFALGNGDHSWDETIKGVFHNAITNAEGFGRFLMPGFSGPYKGTEMEEGANAIFLGAAIGFIPGGVSSVYENKAERRLQTEALQDYENVMKKVGEAYNLIPENYKTPFKTFKVQDQGTDGNPVSRDTYLNSKGELEKDPEKVINFMLRQINDKKFLNEGVVSAMASDPIHDGYNRNVALASYIYGLVTDPNLDRKFIPHLIDAVKPFSDTTAKELGIENVAVDNKELMRKMLATYQKVEREFSNMASLSDDAVSAKFRKLMLKTAYYNEVKRSTLVDLRNDASPEAVEQIDKVIEDTTAFLDKIYSKQDTYLNQYREQYEAFSKADQQSADQDANENAMGKYLKDEYTELEGIFAIEELNKEHSYPTSEEYSGVEPRSFKSLEDRLQGRQLTLKEEDTLRVGRAYMVENALNEKMSNGVAVEGILEYAQANVDYLTDKAKENIKAYTQAKRAALNEEISKAYYDHPFFQHVRPSSDMISLVNRGLEEAKAAVQLAQDAAEGLVGQMYQDENGNEAQVTGDMAVAAGDAEANNYLEESFAQGATVEEARQMLADPNLEKTVDRILTEDNTLNSINNAASQPTIPHVPSTKDQLETKFFNGRISDAKQAAALPAKIKENYTDAEGVSRMLNKLHGMRYTFEKRTDITDAKREQRLATLDKLIEELEELFKVASLNRSNIVEANRQKSLKYGRLFFETIGIEHEENVDGSRSYTVQAGSIAEDMRTAIGEETFDAFMEEARKLKDSTATSMAFSYGPFYALLAVLQNKATAQQLDSIRKRLSDIISTNRGKVSNQLMTNFQANPLKGFDQLIATQAVNVLKMKLEDAHPIRVYRKERDIVKLYETLGNDENSLKLKAIVNVAKTVHGAFSILNLLGSATDLTEVFQAMSKQLSPDYSPGIEQWMTAAEITTAVLASDGAGPLMYGKAGTGKSTYVTRMAAKAAMDLLKLQPTEVYALGPTPTSSANINKILFGATSGRERSNYEDLKTKIASGALKLVILDEAYATKNSVVSQLLDLLIEHKVKFIFTGDPRQLTPDASSVLESNLTPEASKVHIVSPLSIGYRTNIQAIQNLLGRYEWTNANVVGVEGFSNVELGAATSTNTDLFGVMRAPSSEEIKHVIGARNEGDNRTRVIIVANQADKAKYADIAGKAGVIVYDVIEAQSAEYDEVYVDINRTHRLSNGSTMESSMDFNDVMYTAYSRAKKFVMTTDPNVTSKVGEVNADLNFKDIIDGNRGHLNDMVSTIGGLISKYTGQRIATTVATKEDEEPQTPESITPEPPDAPDQPGPSDSDASPTQEFAPDARSPQVGTAQSIPSPDGTLLNTLLHLTYPSSKYLGKFTYKEVEYTLTTGSTIRIFKAPYSKKGKYVNDRVFIIASPITTEAGSDVYAPIAYLSEDDLRQLSPEHRTVLDNLANSVNAIVPKIPGTDRASDVTSVSTLGLFSLPSADASQAIINGKLNAASRINLFLKPTLRLATKQKAEATVLDTVHSFVSRIFTQNNGRKPRLEALQSTIAEELAPNIAVQIFTSRDLNRDVLRSGKSNKHLQGLSDNQLSLIKPGWPYIIVKDVADNYVEGGDPVKFLIPMVFSPISRSWRMSTGDKGEIGMHTLQDFHDNILALERILKDSGTTDYRLGTSAVNKLIESYGKQFFRAGGSYVAGTSGDLEVMPREHPPVFEEFLAAFNKLRREKKKGPIKVSDALKSELQATLNKLVPLTFGIQPRKQVILSKTQFEDPTLIQDEEIRQLVIEKKSDPTSGIQFNEFSYNDNYRAKHHDDPSKFRGTIEQKTASAGKGKVDYVFEPLTIPVMSTENSPVQIALNMLAKANPFIEDRRIYIEKRFSKNNRKVVQAKHLFSSEDSQLDILSEVRKMRVFLEKQYATATNEEREALNEHFKLLDDINLEDQLGSKSFTTILRAARSFGYSIETADGQKVPFTDEVFAYLMNVSTTHPITSDVIGSIVNFEGEYNRSTFQATNPTNNEPLESYLKEPVHLADFNHHGDFPRRVGEKTFKDSWNYVNQRLMDPTDWASPQTAPTHASITIGIPASQVKGEPIRPAVHEEQPDVTLTIEVPAYSDPARQAFANAYSLQHKNATPEEIKAAVDETFSNHSDFNSTLFKDIEKALGKQMSLEESRALVSRLLPGVTDNVGSFTLRFIAKEKLNQMFNGEGNLWGTVRDGIIYVAYEGTSQQPVMRENVIRHEIFHYIFQRHLTQKERLNLFKDLGKLMGVDISRYSEWELEERMAEAFQYWRKGKVKLSFGARLEVLFTELLKLFGFVVRHQGSLNSFFAKINNGYFTEDTQVEDLAYMHDADMRSKRTPLLGFNTANAFLLATRFIRRSMRHLTETTSSTSAIVPGSAYEINRHQFTSEYHSAKAELSSYLSNPELTVIKANRIEELRTFIRNVEQDAKEFAKVLATPEEARNIIRNNLSLEIENLEGHLAALKVAMKSVEDVSPAAYAQLRIKFEYYDAMLNSISRLNDPVSTEDESNEKVFDRIFGKIYPDVLRVKEVETIYEMAEEEMDINEEDPNDYMDPEADMAKLADEIEENETINQEARLTLQLKNWLNNIVYEKQVNDRKEITPVSPRFAFFKMLQLMTDLKVGTTDMDGFVRKMAELRTEYGVKDNTPTDAVFTALENLFLRANESKILFSSKVPVTYHVGNEAIVESLYTVHPRNMKLVVSTARLDRKSPNRQYALLIDSDPNGLNIDQTIIYEDLDTIDEEQVRVIRGDSVQEVFFKSKEMLRKTGYNTDLYTTNESAGVVDQLNNRFVDVFNTLLKKAESQDLLRNIANTFASMKEMDLVIASTEFDYGRNYIKIQTARSLGVQSSVASTIEINIVDSLENLYQTDIKTLVTNGAYTWDMVTMFAERIGLSYMFDKVPYSQRDELARRVGEYLSELYDTVPSPNKAFETIKIDNDETEEGEEDVPRIDYFFLKEGSTVHQISQVVTRDSEWMHNPSMKDSSGKTIYKYVTSYMLHDVVKGIIEGEELPDYLKDPFHRTYNPFLAKGSPAAKVNTVLNKRIKRVREHSRTMAEPVINYFTKPLIGGKLHLEEPAPGFKSTYNDPNAPTKKLLKVMGDMDPSSVDYTQYQAMLNSLVEQVTMRTPSLMRRMLAEEDLDTGNSILNEALNRMKSIIGDSAVTDINDIEVSTNDYIPAYLTTTEEVDRNFVMSRDILFNPETFDANDAERLADMLVASEDAGQSLNIITTETVYNALNYALTSRSRELAHTAGGARTGKIHSLKYYDAHRFEFNRMSRPYSNENNAEFLRREFVAGFLGGLQSSRKGSPTWSIFSFVPAHRPRIPMLQVTLFSPEELVDNIEAMINQIKYSVRDESGLNDFLANRFPAILTNASLLKGVIDFSTLNATQSEIDAVIERLYQDAERVADMIIEEGVRIPDNYRAIISKIAHDKKFSNLLSDNAKSIPEHYKDRVNGKYVVTKEDILPMVQLWVANRMVSSYFLNQIWLGDYAQYKDGGDILKRMMGPTSPGTKGLVHPKFGMRKNYKLGILNDPKASLYAKENEDYVSVESFLKNQLGFTDAEFKALAAYYDEKGYKLADSQGFVLPSRVKEYMKGFSRSWGVGSLFKPMYYGPGSATTLVNGVPSETFFQFYTKFSSVELSDDLVAQFPALGALRRQLEDQGIDEAVLASAVKVGLPSASSENDFGKFEQRVQGQEVDATFKGVVTLDNNYFRMQYNPASPSFTDLSPFTQLLYFLKVFANDDIKNNNEYALKAYSAVSFLVQSELDEIMNTFDQRKGDTPAIVAKRASKYLLKHLNVEGNERLFDLLQSGVALDNPVIAQKALIQLMSNIVKNTIGLVRFPGGKFQLQADFGTRLRTIDGEVRSKPLMYQTKEITRNTPNGPAKETIHYSEVIIPKGFLPKDIEDRVLAGEDVFQDVDGFAYRIPSTELHSAIAIKIVGIYDSKGTNVIIVPHQLVAIMGHDFDADAMFTVSRKRLTDSPKTLEKYRKELNSALDTKAGRELLQNLFGDGYIGYKKVRGKLMFDWDATSKFQLLASYIRSSEENQNEATMKRLDRILDNMERTLATNIIVQSMIDTITSSKNRMRMVTPIQQVLVDRDIRNMLTELKVPAPPSFDMTRVENTIAAYRSIFDGRKLTGVFANALKVFSYIMDSGPATDKKTFSPPVIKEEDRFLVDGKEITTFQEFDSKGRPVVEMLDMLVNVAIDNPKNQGLPILGATMKTANFIITMLMSGVPLETIVLFLRGPIMKELNKSKYGRNFDSAIRSLRKNLVENVYKLAKDHKDYRSASLNLDTTELKSMINDSLDDMLAGKSSTEEVAKLIQMLDFAAQVNKTGSTLFTISRWFKIIKDFPVKDVDVIRFQNVLDKDLKILNDKSIETLVNTFGLGKSQDIHEFFTTIEEMTKNPNSTLKLETTNLTLDMPNMFVRNPHIAVLSAIISKIINGYLPNIFTKFNKELGKAIASSGFVRDLNVSDAWDPDSPDRRAALLDEYMKVLIAQTIYANPAWNKKINEAKFIRTSRAGAVMVETGPGAWTQQFIRKIGALKRYNDSLNADDQNRISLLDAINIKGHQIRYMSLSAGSSLQYTDYKKFEEDLKKLEEFDVTPTTDTDRYGNPTYKVTKNTAPSNDLTEDFMIFVTLSGATKFFSSSMVNILPPYVIGDNDKQYGDELRQKFVTPANLKEYIGPFMVVVAATNVDRLPYLEKALSSRKVVNNTQITQASLADLNNPGANATQRWYKPKGALNPKTTKEWAGVAKQKDGRHIFYDLMLSDVPSYSEQSKLEPPRLMRMGSSDNQKAYVLIYDEVLEGIEQSHNYYYKEIGNNPSKISPELIGKPYFFSKDEGRGFAVTSSHFSYAHATIPSDSSQAVEQDGVLTIKSNKDIRYILQDKALANMPVAVVNRMDFTHQDRQFYRVKGILRNQGSVLDANAQFTYIVEPVESLNNYTPKSADDFVKKYKEEATKAC